MAANQKLVDTVKAVARRHGATPAQVALAWVLTEAQDAVAIPGSKRRAYLDDNLEALNVRLNAEDMTDLNRLASMAVGERYPPAMEGGGAVAAETGNRYWTRGTRRLQR